MSLIVWPFWAGPSEVPKRLSQRMIDPGPVLEGDPMEILPRVVDFLSCPDVQSRLRRSDLLGMQFARALWDAPEVLMQSASGSPNRRIVPGSSPSIDTRKLAYYAIGETVPMLVTGSWILLGQSEDFLYEERRINPVTAEGMAEFLSDLFDSPSALVAFEEGWTLDLSLAAALAEHKDRETRETLKEWGIEA